MTLDARDLEVLVWEEKYLPESIIESEQKSFLKFEIFKPIYYHFV
jgi:hypothetical protein